MSDKKMYHLGLHVARLVSCLIFIACVVFIYILIVNLRPAVIPDAANRVVEGVLDLKGLRLSEPVEIVGEWARYPYVSYSDLPLDFTTLADRLEWIEVPMPITALTNHASAYRLLILHDSSVTEVYINLSPIQANYMVLLNGEHIFGSGMEGTAASIIPMMSIAAFQLQFDMSREYQELVILVCDTYEGADFFHSEFIIGDYESIRLYVVKRLATWALISGLLLMLLLNRLIFMMICPENEIASLMTLVDTAVVSRVLLGIPELYHIKTVLLGFSISNENIARLNFMPVLFIGVVTIHFVGRIFNAENQVDKKWFHAISLMFCTVGAVFFFNIHMLATNLGFIIFLFFFLPGCVLGAWVFVRYLREHRLSKLQILYIGSLAVIGLMIWYDITTMRHPRGNFLVLITGYFILILINLCASLFENYSKYKELQVVTQEQKRLENLLHTVNNAAAVLLAAEDNDGFESSLMQGMEMIGHCLGADRVQLWRADLQDENLNLYLANQWSSEIGANNTQINFEQTIPYSSIPLFPTLEKLYVKGESLNSPVSKLPIEEQRVLNLDGSLKSLVAIPIFLQERFWGFFNIDDCVRERRLSNDEMDILRSASLMMGSTYHRVELHRRQQRIEIIEESNKAKSRFLARMSHEIRTPITAVLGISEIQLQDEKLPGNIEESFVKIYNSAKLLLGIINDILDLSKIEAGKMTIINEKYELMNLISDVVHLHLANLDNDMIAFVLKADENLPAFMIGDYVRIEQIVSNLLSNAFKYTQSGRVELSLNSEADGDGEGITLLISIRDTGLGMSTEQLDALYKEYTRFHEGENRLISGTGLGMAIVYNLVEMMKAEIILESEVGIGTSVLVRIPQKRHGAENLGKEAAERLSLFDVSGHKAAKHIKFVPEPMPYGSVLVVDDIEANLYVAKGLLAFYGLNIETCSDGQEAIEKIKSAKVYDIIFMDHMMPGIDGVETMRAMREMGYDKAIVVLTANAMIGQHEEYISLGFDDFLPKPIQSKELNIILQKYIRDKRALDEDGLSENGLGEDAALKLENYLDNIEMIEKLRFDFAREQKNMFADICEAIDTGDIKTAHRLAHSLKSLAGLIKENSLAQLSGAVEHMLANNKIPERPELEALGEELKNVLEAIGKPENAGFPAAGVFEKDKLRALIDELKPLLEDSNVDCLNLLEELRQIPETAVLIRQIENFDFAIALDNINTLLEIIDEMAQ